MDQRIIDLYDRFTHGGMSRRTFMTRLAGLAGGSQAALTLLPELKNDYESSPVVDPGDSSIHVEYMKYPGASGEVRAYHAAPSGDGPFPAVIVIHENRGLNPHIEDVTRRAAAAGFWALAPDALSPLGGTPEDEDRAREMIGRLDSETAVSDFVAAVPFALKRQDTTDRVGCVGFCWGGAMANQMAVHAPDLDAAVAFYGRQPEAADVPGIRAELLLHYAELDSRINAGIADYASALKDAGVAYELYTYEGVNHAFHNDTSPTRYNAEAARLAWDRTIAFFDRTLRGD